MEGKFEGTEFEEMREGEPSAARIEAIRNQIASSLHPVTPLPSDWSLIAWLTAGFIGLGVLCALPIGVKGFHAMKNTQRLFDYLAILSCAAVLARTLTGEIIPASRRRVGAGPVITAVFAVTTAITVVLFPDETTGGFFRSGIPCLAIGSLCALPASVLIGLIMRRGMLTDTLAGVLTAAALSGTLGVFVLALHCPILSAAHILTWHLGVTALCLGAGVLVARKVEYSLTGPGHSS
jgi:hypothetical protein